MNMKLVGIALVLLGAALLTPLIAWTAWRIGVYGFSSGFTAGMAPVWATRMWIASGAGVVMMVAGIMSLRLRGVVPPAS